MQINSQHIYQKSVVPEDPLELKQEEVYRASVKEKLNGSEAILQIRGKDNETPNENRRKYFRIDLKTPLHADMTIAMFNGKKVHLGSTKVEILDIGPGGLRIKTNMKLPIRNDLILKFKMTILDKHLDLPGTVVWKKEVDFEYNMYGIQFNMNDKQRKDVTSLLNRFQVKHRKSIN